MRRLLDWAVAHIQSLMLRVSSLETSASSITDGAIPMIVLYDEGRTPYFPPITGKANSFGNQIAWNRTDGNKWFWTNELGWIPF